MRGPVRVLSGIESRSSHRQATRRLEGRRKLLARQCEGLATAEPHWKKTKAALAAICPPRILLAMDASIRASQLRLQKDLANIDRQLNVCRSKLQYFKDKALAKSMGTYIDDIRARASKALQTCGGKFRVGADYCIAARVAGSGAAAGGAAAPPSAPL